MGTPRSRRLKHVIFALIPASVAALVCFILYQLLVERDDGRKLNRAAWDASYTERGMPPPRWGPREGIWCLRLAPIVEHENPKVKWRDAERHFPLLFDIDENGFQHFKGNGSDKTHIMIVGASVARGTYASRISTTYFHVLGEELEKRDLSVDMTIVAAGAWRSSQEIAALEWHGKDIKPDLIMMIDGLNDITNGITATTRWGEGGGTSHAHDYDNRIAHYLANIKTAARRAAELQSPLLVVLQPSLLEKKSKTSVEQTLYRMALRIYGPATKLTESYQALRDGLAALEQARALHYLDASRIYDAEKHTIFADEWHFSDFGHKLLADAIVPKLEQLLAARTAR
jgi:lysophospholipase L1-like esterase